MPEAFAPGIGERRTLDCEGVRGKNNVPRKRKIVGAADCHHRQPNGYLLVAGGLLPSPDHDTKRGPEWARGRPTKSGDAGDVEGVRGIPRINPGGSAGSGKWVWGGLGVCLGGVWGASRPSQQQHNFLRETDYCFIIESIVARFTPIASDLVTTQYSYLF